MTKEDIIKSFIALKGIGQAKAEALYEGGFTSLEKLKKASLEDLTAINGITKNIAESILEELSSTEKTEVQATEEKQPAKKESAKPATPAKEPVKKPETTKKETPTKKESSSKPKQKPELSTELSNKLEIRKEIKKRTPTFLREEWFRYKRIPRNWRRPDGITSKMRINLKYRPSRVRVGFSGPKETRGLHPSGFEEVLIHNVKDLETINPKTQAARIGGTVGMKKRLAIAKKAEELHIRILNMRV